MGLLTSLITEHMRGKRQKEDAAQQAYTRLLGTEGLPDEVYDWAFQGLKGTKGNKEMGPAIDMVEKHHKQIRQQQGGAPQGPAQVPPVPGSMDVSRRTAMVGEQPQPPSAQDLASLPQTRMNPIMPPSVATSGQEVTYSGNQPIPSRPEEMRQPPPPNGPPQIPPLPQTVTRMSLSPFRPVPPVPGAPEAGGGQPGTGEPAAQPKNRWEAARAQQDERALGVFKRQQDIIRENKIAEERAKEEFGGMKANAQRVVFKSPGGTLTRALQDMRRPGVYYNPATGGPMVGPAPGTEVLTESELDRDDAAEVRKQDKEEKRTTAAQKKQEEYDEAREIAQSIVEGRQQPDLSRMYGKSMLVRSILEKEFKYDLKNATLDWQATSRWYSTQNGPRQQALRQATFFALESLDKLDAPDPKDKSGDLIGKLNSAVSTSKTRFKILNKASLAAAKQGLLGQEAQDAAVLLESQIADLQSELAVVYKGGNSPTDMGLKQASEMLASDWSESTLRKAIDLSRQNLGIRLNSIKHAGAITPGSIATSGYSPFASVPPPPTGGGGPTVAADGGGGGRQAMDGYIIGREYGDAGTYQGGNPDDPTSWRK